MSGSSLWTEAQPKRGSGPVRSTGVNTISGRSMSGRSAWTKDYKTPLDAASGESMSGRSVLWAGLSGELRCGEGSKYVRSIGSVGPNPP
jgi:hypothetical protein